MENNAKFKLNVIYEIIYTERNEMNETRILFFIL